MARPVVGNPFDGQIGTVAPTARPVDTYERGVVNKSPFEALSNTLSNLQNKAIPALQREEARRAEAEYASGVELYNENRVAIGQAVKDGVIAEGESPYLRKGYRISHINSMSARYADELQHALNSQKLYTNGNPAAIEAFTDKFYDEFQTNNGMNEYRDVEVAEFFSPQAARANETFRASWQAKHITWQAAANYAAWSNEVSTYTATLFNDDDTPELRAEKQVQLGQWLTQKVADADVDGMNRAKVSQTVVDSIIMSAYENDDLEMLDILDNVVTGTGPMSGSLATRRAMYDAEGKIATNLARQQKATADALKQRQQAELEALNGDVVQAALFDRYSDDPEVAKQAQAVISEALNQVLALSDLGVAGASDKARVLVGFVNAMDADKEAEIPDVRTGETVLTAERAVLDLDTVDEVYKYLTQQKADGFIDRTDANAILSYWSNNVKAVPEVKLHMMDPQSPARQTQDAMIRSFGLTNEFGAFTSVNRIIAQQARDAYSLMYREQIAETKKQLGKDRLSYAEQLEIAESVRSRLTPQYQDATVLQEAANELQAIENNRAEAEATAAALAVATGGVAVGGAPTLEETLTNITGGSN